MKRFLISFNLFFCLLALVCGCESSRKLSSETAPRAEARGKGISAECVVTFYKSDGSRYLSRQEHLIHPSGGGIVISASEPGSKLRCRLDKGGFSQEVSGREQVDLPIPLCEKALLQSLWASVTAGCGFLDESAGTVSEAIKIEGQWYEPMELNKTISRSVQTTIYRNTDSSRVDMVEVSDPESEIVLTARSYNYFWFNELGKQFPMKIEVFRGEPGGKGTKRILEISYQLPIEWK